MTPEEQAGLEQIYGSEMFRAAVVAIRQEHLAAAGVKQKRPRKQAAYRITFNDREFVGITDADVQQWQAAFPAVAVPAEIRKAESWMASNEASKKNCGRFLHAWFSKQQRIADGKV